VFLRLASMAAAFFLYSGVCLVGAILVYAFVPETKGKTLEELEIALKTH
jgi:MFS transporter, SP family, xylose:H+ symportor